MNYYQEILGLQNWIIGIHLTNDPVIAPNWGSSKIFRAMHIAEIFIPMPYEGQINPFPQKYTQELILVHELCHVLLPTFEVDHNTNEGFFFDSENHARLEAVAKALIMSKYNLDISWFWNF